MTIARVERANPLPKRLLWIQENYEGHPFWSMVGVHSHYACWGWLGNLDSDGYGYQGRERAHRTAWELYNRSSLTPGAVVRHSCDNPSCCNPTHLELGTQADNNRDRKDRDRGAKGSVNGRALLSNADALSIFHSPEPQAAIARKYGVSLYTVSDIKRGKTWGWLTGKEYSHGGNNGPVRKTSAGAKSDA